MSASSIFRLRLRSIKETDLKRARPAGSKGGTVRRSLSRSYTHILYKAANSMNQYLVWIENAWVCFVVLIITKTCIGADAWFYERFDSKL